MLRLCYGVGILFFLGFTGCSANTEEAESDGAENSEAASPEASTDTSATTAIEEGVSASEDETDTFSSSAGADADSGSDAEETEDTTDSDTTDSSIDSGEQGGGGENGGEEDTTIDSDAFAPDASIPEYENGYPSEELNITIVGPGASDFVQSLGYITSVSGILFGEAEEIQWTHLDTGETGTADPGAFWQTDGIQLQEGDNRVEVVAIAEDGETSKDIVTILYNPSFLFGGAPKAAPATTFTGANTKHVVTIAITYSNAVPGTIKLWELDEEGDATLELGEMKDNGNLNAQCDEVEGDGIFSRCLTLNESSPVDKMYRVSTDVVNVFETYEAWSPLLTVEVVAPMDTTVCTDHQALLQAAQAAYGAAIDAGETANAAQISALDTLLADPSVSEAGAVENGYGVWVQFSSGVLGGIPLSPANMRGSSGLETSSLPVGTITDLGSKEVSVLAPGSSSFGDFDESTWIADTLEGLGCPYFAVALFQNEYANLYRFRRIYGNGIISVSAHGDTLFRGLSEEARAAFQWEHDGAQEIIWTGEVVDCGKFLSQMQTCSGDGSVCQSGAGECVIGSTSYCVDYKSADLTKGRLVMGPDSYGVIPSYIKHHARQSRLPNSLAFLGSCRSMYNGSFASVLFGLGAKTIVGFSNYVTNEFAFNTAQTFMEGLASDAEISGDAFAAVENTEEVDGNSAEARLFGAKNLSISNADIVNASFESKDTTGWTRDGDGRVISSLGGTIPVDGKYMGLLSTGLGFTQEVGQLQQKFCLKSDVTEVSFYWKFYSEEFLEFCGSSFQDAFTATLKNDDNQVTIIDVAIDDICPATECGGCGSAAAEYNITLIPSDVSFDQGGVYQGDWVKSTANVSNLAGEANGPVTFTYFTSDTGDSIYDTVILVDKLSFE